MSLEARRAFYFNFCVGARFRLTPIPTSYKEVRFLHESFSKLGNLEYFQVEKPKHLSSTLFGRHVTVLLNPADQFSQLDPLNAHDNTLQTTVATLRQRQRELNLYLLSICGVPRFSYIENDKLYFDGRVEVPFKHSLNAKGTQYAGQYSLTSSTIDSPFTTIETESDSSAVLAALRHNFQKFHKLEPVFVKNGIKAVQMIGENSDRVRFTIDADAVGDVDVTDLHKRIPVGNVREDHKTFNGFMDFNKITPDV